MRHLFLIVALFVALLSSRSADAQFLATDDRPEFITVSTSTTSAVVVGVIMLTVVSVKKDPLALQRYLQQNEPAVQAALAVGGGPAVEDLAMFFDVPSTETARFGSALRRRRAALSKAFEANDFKAFASIARTAYLFERMR